MGRPITFIQMTDEQRIEETNRNPRDWLIIKTDKGHESVRYFKKVGTPKEVAESNNGALASTAHTKEAADIICASFDSHFK